MGQKGPLGPKEPVTGRTRGMQNMRVLGLLDRGVSRLSGPAVVALVMGAATPAGADQGVMSYYLGLRAIGTQSMVDDVSNTGFAGTQNVENDSDVVGGIGIVAGTRFRDLPVRLELEVAHRFRFDFDVRDQMPANVIDHEANIATTTALVSAILEWRNDTSFTPFVGGAVGWARNDVETDRIDIATQVKTTSDNETDNFAWGGTAGVDWDFWEHWTAQAAYRYTDLGEVETGVNGNGESISADSYTSHDLLLSILFRF